jgi:NADH dehydrogenase/NADH:ubiquinone oxidoreductase subunit G
MKSKGSSQPERSVSIQIDGQELTVEDGQPLLDAAEAAGIWIPKLCNLPGTANRAVCRLCLVKVKGMLGLVPSCSTGAQEGMIVDTNQFTVRATRQMIMEMILLEHGECGDPDCEIENLAKRLGANANRFSREPREDRPLTGSDHIEFDADKCVLCDRCVRTCYLGIISRSNRGQDATLSFDSGPSLGDSRCTACGDCVAVCPTGALRSVSSKKSAATR